MKNIMKNEFRIIYEENKDNFIEEIICSEQWLYYIVHQRYDWWGRIYKTISEHKAFIAYWLMQYGYSIEKIDYAFEFLLH